MLITFKVILIFKIPKSLKWLKTAFKLWNNTVYLERKDKKDTQSERFRDDTESYSSKALTRKKILLKIQQGLTIS